MACKTCDHTMQRVNDGYPRVFWCPRCGTLKSEGMALCQVREFERPKIVERSMALCATIDDVLNDLEISPDDERPSDDSLEYRTKCVRECCQAKT